MVDLLSWRIALRSRPANRFDDMAASVITIAPQFRHESMPDELALLLPTNAGPKRLIDAVVAAPALCRDAVLGLFLADPFLDVARDSGRLRDAGIHWIANLPSVEQQDDDFSQQLTDVGLDRDREYRCLARFRAEGFKVAAIAADGPAGAAAAAFRPEAIVVLPRVADFAAGFPSSRQRGAAAQAVSTAAREAGWSGLLLGLGQAQEVAHEGQWPDCLDGLLCRPKTPVR